jgi:hypothetical protein
MEGLKVFRSPLTKLVKFFQRSRDEWKQKHHQVKHQLKLEQNQVRAVEKSREVWRVRAEAAERRVRELEAALSETKRPAPPRLTS